jgi:hypothetical protein
VIAFVKIVLRLLADLIGLAMLGIRPRQSLEAENLFLRRELALYRERGMKPRRIDAATTVSAGVSFWAVRLAPGAGGSTPGDSNPLAPSGMAATVALQVAAELTADPIRTSPADSAHGQ